MPPVLYIVHCSPSQVEILSFEGTEESWTRHKSGPRTFLTKHLSILTSGLIASIAVSGCFSDMQENIYLELKVTVFLSFAITST